MSGGHFDYQQYRIDDIANEIERIIMDNKNTEVDEWGSRVGRFYTNETICLLIDAHAALKRAATYAQRVDWLLSGDDSEESFARRLKEDLKRNCTL